MNSSEWFKWIWRANHYSAYENLCFSRWSCWSRSNGIIYCVSHIVHVPTSNILTIRGKISIRFVIVVEIQLQFGVVTRGGKQVAGINNNWVEKRVEGLQTNQSTLFTLSMRQKMNCLQPFWIWFVGHCLHSL